jgi:hypothetical protein
MEISPVDSIRMVPMVKSRITDLGLMDVYDIEQSSIIRDETYSPSGQKAATGAEGDDDDDDQDAEDTYDDQEEDTEAEPKAPPAADGQIDYVA